MSVHCSPSPGSRESGLRPQGGQVPSGGDRARGRFPGRGSQPGLQLTSLWGYWGAAGLAVLGSPAPPWPRPGRAAPSLPASPFLGHREAPGTAPPPARARPSRSAGEERLALGRGGGVPVEEELHGDLGVDVKAQHAETGWPRPGACSELLPSPLPSPPAPCAAGWEGSAWPPGPCLSPSPNPIHLPSPVLGSSYPRQPPLTPAPTSGLPPLLQHPRGSPKWRWQRAGIWDTRA